MGKGLHKGLLIGACLMLWLTGVQGQTSGTGSGVERCGRDHLARVLHDKFPNGVPGRTLPSMDKVSEVDSAFTYVIPVVVHVMYSLQGSQIGPEHNITPEQIHSQIDILNEGFGRYGEGANTDALGGDAKIKFCLASIDPDGNPTLGYDYLLTEYASDLNPLTEDTLMKKLNQWDPDRYMNIWTVRKISTTVNGTVLEYEGYTYIPEQVAGSPYDGIVMKYSSLGRDVGNALTRGKTGTHEAGHYFDLHHPWGDAEEQFCPANSDYCDDTPPVPNIEFTQFPACLDSNYVAFACDGTHRQVENYMDYSQDECLHLFTKCQIQRMRTALLRYRSRMVSAENLRLTGCGPMLDSIPSQGQIFVYPNPANHYMMVNVDIDNAGPVELVLYDFAGRRVWWQTEAGNGKGPISVDLSTIAQGCYYLRATTGSASYSTKVFVGRFEE